MAKKAASKGGLPHGTVKNVSGKSANPGTKKMGSGKGC